MPQARLEPDVGARGEVNVPLLAHAAHLHLFMPSHLISHLASHSSRLAALAAAGRVHELHAVAGLVHEATVPPTGLVPFQLTTPRCGVLDEGKKCAYSYG